MHCLIDPLCESWKEATVSETGLSAPGLYKSAPLASYISIKTQEEWIGNAQGVTSLPDMTRPASN